MIRTKLKMGNLSDKYIDKAATVGGKPAPNGVYEVSAGKVKGTISSLKQYLESTFNAAGQSVSDGTFTVRGGYITKFTPVDAASTQTATAATILGIMAAAPPSHLKGKRVIIDGAAAPDGSYVIQGGVVVTSTELEPRNQLAAEWDRSFRAGEHLEMRRQDPVKYQRLFFAKYGKPANL